MKTLIALCLSRFLFRVIAKLPVRSSKTTGLTPFTVHVIFVMRLVTGNAGNTINRDGLISVSVLVLPFF